jgi:hypothetical protein
MSGDSVKIHAESIAAEDGNLLFIEPMFDLMEQLIGTVLVRGTNVEGTHDPCGDIEGNPNPRFPHLTRFGLEFIELDVVGKEVLEEAVM